jgi:hypothetical protein
MKPFNPNPPSQPTCHCMHVHAIELKIGIAQWLIAACIVMVLGVAGTLIGSFISKRVSYTEPGSSSERLFMDRVNAPEPRKE